MNGVMAAEPHDSDFVLYCKDVTTIAGSSTSYCPSPSSSLVPLNGSQWHAIDPSNCSRFCVQLTPDMRGFLHHNGTSFEAITAPAEISSNTLRLNRSEEMGLAQRASLRIQERTPTLHHPSHILLC